MTGLLRQILEQTYLGTNSCLGMAMNGTQATQHYTMGFDPTIWAEKPT